MSLPYLKLSDLLPETHIFRYLALSHMGKKNLSFTPQLKSSSRTVLEKIRVLDLFMNYLRAIVLELFKNMLQDSSLNNLDHFKDVS